MVSVVTVGWLRDPGAAGIVMGSQAIRSMPALMPAPYLSVPAQIARLKAHIRCTEEDARYAVEPYRSSYAAHLKALQQDLADLEWAHCDGLWE